MIQRTALCCSLMYSGVPQIAEHVAGRHVADTALTVIVCPATRSRAAVVPISETVFVHSLEENELGVLVVGHVVLLVRDYEIFDALRDGVIGVCHFHFEGPDGRMAGVGRAQYVAEVRVSQSFGARQELPICARLD